MPRQPQQPVQREMPLILRFPMFGIDLSQAYSAQRPQTCVSGINVQAYEAGQSRMRGGTRPGLTPIIGGAGSTLQVDGFNPIQSLSVIVTASPSATFNSTFNGITLALSYSETDSPPVRNAPNVAFPEDWFVGTTPTYTETSGVIVGTPDAGGTGQGTCSLKLSTDGTTVTLVATFISAGFVGPYFYSGPGQVQTITETNANFFGHVANLSGSWTVVNAPSIAILGFVISCP